MIDKQMRESTAQAVCRYADEQEADFIAIGTNIGRVERGKEPIGGVSLQICMECDRNFIVAHWLDLNATVYDENVRPDMAAARPGAIIGKTRGEMGA